MKHGSGSGASRADRLASALERAALLKHERRGGRGQHRLASALERAALLKLERDETNLHLLVLASALERAALLKLR